MKALPIVWQRLVGADGKTCERCLATQAELARALTKLTEALRPLGIEPVLEAKVLNEAAFWAKPSESNRLWIAGRPVEEWLGAGVGASKCCAVCGEAECRTLQVEGVALEVVPEQLLVKAVLAAALTLL